CTRTDARRAHSRARGAIASCARAVVAHVTRNALGRPAHRRNAALRAHCNRIERALEPAENNPRELVAAIGALPFEVCCSTRPRTMSSTTPARIVHLTRSDWFRLIGAFFC